MRDQFSQLKAELAINPANTGTTSLVADPGTSSDVSDSMATNDIASITNP